MNESTPLMQKVSIDDRNNSTKNVGIFFLVLIGAMLLIFSSGLIQVHDTAFAVRGSNAVSLGSNNGLWPRRGYKLQLNVSMYTVNDYDCMQIDTGDWPSERIHCETRSDGTTDFVVEHFDDPHCQKHNHENPSVTHTAAGCFFFPSSNHSYNDKCHPNGTFTISAFLGSGCLAPMPVTAVNLLDE